MTVTACFKQSVVPSEREFPFTVLTPSYSHMSEAMLREGQMLFDVFQALQPERVKNGLFEPKWALQPLGKRHSRPGS
jgi:hypothetical protein